MIEEKRVKAEYRSSIRSKAMIRNALLALMQEKPFEKISVTDIVTRADINRGTFYAHYSDTREVLETIRHGVIKEMDNVFEGHSADDIILNPRPIFEAMTAFLKKDEDYYRMLVSLDGFFTAFAGKKHLIVEGFMNTSIVRSFPDKEKEAEMLINFCVSATIEMYVDALLGRMTITIDELPAVLTKIIANILKPILKKN